MSTRLQRFRKRRRRHLQITTVCLSCHIVSMSVPLPACRLQQSQCTAEGRSPLVVSPAAAGRASVRDAEADRGQRGEAGGDRTQVHVCILEHNTSRYLCCFERHKVSFPRVFSPQVELLHCLVHQHRLHLPERRPRQHHPGGTVSQVSDQGLHTQGGNQCKQVDLLRFCTEVDFFLALVPTFCSFLL